MEFYEEIAKKLIGIEVELSRKLKNFPVGYTTGKAKIKRFLLKEKFGITSNYGLECLRDALSELGYSLIELNFYSDLILVNNKNFLTNFRQITDEDIDNLKDVALKSAEEFFKAAPVKEKNKDIIQQNSVEENYEVR